MGTSENDLKDFYHDDPAPQIPKNKLRSKFITTGVLILGSVFFFQSTLASNISLNSGSGVEFGQGVSQAVACSGNTNLTLTPRSSFTNGSPGGHYLQSVTVSNIPTSCYGVDFRINAYGDSGSSPLALFNSTSTEVIVFDNDGTFEGGRGSDSFTVSTSGGGFTVTFGNPVASSESVFKLTIQSSVHSLYQVGDRGPGNGIVFYISASYFTSTGSTCNTRCRYLEVTPAGWNNSGVITDDPQIDWSSTFNSFVINSGSSASTEGPVANRAAERVSWQIGKGFQNTSRMAYGGSSAASAAAISYAGTDSSAGQWFIPSMNELNELCKYARGQATGTPSVACNSSGTLKTTAFAGSDLGGFAATYYWASNEFSTANAYMIEFIEGSNSNYKKTVANMSIRPIRAF